MKKFILYLCSILFLVCFFISCSVNNTRIDNNLKKYFDAKQVEGCFTMLNNAGGEVTVYNMELDTQRFTPLSTYQIINGLIGLETGDITNDTMLVRDSGITGINMKTAFKTNSYLYTQQIADRIGKDTLQVWIDSIGYGNKNINGAGSGFWLDGKLKISADEQLGLMKRLYFEQLPFRKSSHEMIKDAMLKENTTNYSLSYDSAFGTDEKGHGIGWVVGWIEENKHVYFFTTFLKGGSKNAALAITKDILKQYGFFEGKK